MRALYIVYRLEDDGKWKWLRDFYDGAFAFNFLETYVGQTNETYKLVKHDIDDHDIISDQEIVLKHSDDPGFRTECKVKLCMKLRQYS